MTSSGKGSQSTSLDDSKNQLSSVIGRYIISNLQFHIAGESHQYVYSLSIYLLIPTRVLPFTWEYNQSCLIIGLYYLLHTNISLNLIKADQTGFNVATASLKKRRLVIKLFFNLKWLFLQNLVHYITCYVMFFAVNLR